MTPAWPARLAGFELEHHARIGSTQDRARERAGEGATRAVVVADMQTGGRGRPGRSWLSPAGNLYASAVLVRHFPAALTPSFSLVAAVALLRALEEAAAAPLPLRLKWPNDVLLDGRKLAGLLLEATGTHVIVGLGLNLAHAPDGAATLEAADLHPPAPALLEPWLAGLDAGARDLEEVGFAGWREAWLARAAWLHERVRVVLNDRVLEGVHRGVDAYGALLVETAAGTEAVLAGDVEQVRLGEAI